MDLIKKLADLNKRNWVPWATGEVLRGINFFAQKGPIWALGAGGARAGMRRGPFLRPWADIKPTRTDICRFGRASLVPWSGVGPFLVVRPLVVLLVGLVDPPWPVGPPWSSLGRLGRGVG